jgi:hypothetical protein
MNRRSVFAWIFVTLVAVLICYLLDWHIVADVLLGVWFLLGLVMLSRGECSDEDETPLEEVVAQE